MPTASLRPLQESAKRSRPETRVITAGRDSRPPATRQVLAQGVPVGRRWASPLKDRAYPTEKEGVLGPASGDLRGRPSSASRRPIFWPRERSLAVRPSHVRGRSRRDRSCVEHARLTHRRRSPSSSRPPRDGDGHRPPEARMRGTARITQSGSTALEGFPRMSVLPENGRPYPGHRASGRTTALRLVSFRCKLGRRAPFPYSGAAW